MGLGEGEQWLYFDLACHLGTWVALVFFLRREIGEVFRSVRKMALFALAMLPLVPAYFLFKPVRVYLSAPVYTGVFLIVTGLLLFLANRSRDRPPRKIPAVICIGVAQAMALLPGLSRSGSTIATGKLWGWSWVEAARFSFLLAVPTIFGGELLESWKLLGQEVPVDLLACFVGFCSALGVGLLSVRWVFWLYEKRYVKPFAWYCLAFGLVWILNG
jgi:undecaprenyl-diphosphatase